MGAWQSDLEKTLRGFPGAVLFFGEGRGAAFRRPSNVRLGEFWRGINEDRVFHEAGVLRCSPGTNHMCLRGTLLFVEERHVI